MQWKLFCGFLLGSDIHQGPTVACHSNPDLSTLHRTKVLSYTRNWLLVIKLYKYESLRIMLTWSNAPSVSYCGIFLSSSEASSTIQDSFTKPRIARVQHSKIAHGPAMRMRHLSVTLSVEFANANTAQKPHYRPDTDNRSDYWCTTSFIHSSPTLCVDYGNFCLHT